jgi:hypothetical protein
MIDMDTTAEVADQDAAQNKKGPTAGDIGGAVAASVGKAMASMPKRAAAPASAPAMPDVPQPTAVAPVRVASAPMQTVAVRAPSFKIGGKVHRTGVYILHKGERVLNKEQAMNHDILSGKVKPKSKIKLVAVSKGHKPAGAHGRAAVHELGRTKTTGNFKRIEAAHGKGAAIAAFQNAKRAHDAGK